MKEIITNKGVLKYRMPDVLEAYDLLEASGIAYGVTSTLKLKRNIINEMSSLVDLSGIEGALTYKDLLDDVENMVIPLGEIADEVIEKTFEVFKKKS